MPVFDSDPPMYFRRVWTGNTALDEVVVTRTLPDGTFLVELTLGDLAPVVDEVVSLVPPEGFLIIYGRKVRSSFPEDAEYIDACEARGLVYTESFSVACEDGEVGTHPLALLTEITKDEFDAARGRGWV